MIEVTLSVGLLLGFAALIATYLRLTDAPATPFTLKNLPVIAETYFGSAVAAVLTAWVIGLQGLYVTDLTGFLMITTGAVGGMVAVRALMDKFKPAPVPVPPVE
jgi:hypothetical protein